MDAIPGKVNHLSFVTPSDPGVFVGQCAEFCGIQHAMMLTRVRVVAGERVPAASLTDQLKVNADIGRMTFEGACAPCHGLNGEGLIGPSLQGNSTLADPAAPEGAARERQGQDAAGRQGLDAARARRADRVPRRRDSPVAVRAETPTYQVPWYRGRVASWITTVDHKRIGILYLVTCLVFFGAGGILALLMRTQLAQPNEGFLTQDSYNEVMTIHGVTMVFLVVVPILAGFGNYLVPLMIGARDVAFPRLNALSYWLFLFGGLVLFSSFFAAGGAAKTGWTIYPPLSEQSQGRRRSTC